MGRIGTRCRSTRTLIKLFCEHPKEWEEFQIKSKSQVGAENMKGKDNMEEIETTVETTVEEEDWTQVRAEDVTEKMVGSSPTSCTMCR